MSTYSYSCYLQRQRIVVVVGTKLTCGVRVFSAIDVLLVVVVVGQLKFFSITIDNLMGHGLPLQFGPIYFAAGR